VSESVVVASIRADEVLEKIFKIKEGMVCSVLDLGELLSEAKQNDYPHVWGFNNFDEWLDQSGLEVGRRTAYYFIRIVEQSKALGISREQLSKSQDLPPQRDLHSSERTCRRD
jgi:hypothetical protein